MSRLLSRPTRMICYAMLCLSTKCTSFCARACPFARRSHICLHIFLGLWYVGALNTGICSFGSAPGHCLATASIIHAEERHGFTFARSARLTRRALRARRMHAGAGCSQGRALASCCGLGMPRCARDAPPAPSTARGDEETTSQIGRAHV